MYGKQARWRRRGALLLIMVAVLAAIVLAGGSAAAQDAGASGPAPPSDSGDPAAKTRGDAVSPAQGGNPEPGPGTAELGAESTGWIAEQLDGLIEKIKKTITESALDATSAFINKMLAPNDAILQSLEAMIKDRPPPGSDQWVRVAWSESWWAAVALLVVATVVQAIRIAAARADAGEEMGRQRWLTWMMTPLIGAVLARVSLFIVDLTVLVQNQMWGNALSGTPACEMVYGVCDVGVSTGAVAGALTNVFVMMALLVVALLFWLVYMCIGFALGLLAVIGPIYIALSASGHTPAPLAGWLNLVVRTSAMQSVVGVGLSIIRGFQQSAAAGGEWARFYAGSGLVHLLVLALLLFALIYWGVLPLIAAGTDLVTLKGGATLEGVGRITGMVGGILAGAGVVTGNPALIAAGQKASMAGTGLSQMGQRARMGAEERQRAMQPHGVGGWIARAVQQSVGGLDAQSAHPVRVSARLADGLLPMAPYRVLASPNLPPGTVQVSAAPGLAAAAARALLHREMDVDFDSTEFQVDAGKAEWFWSVVAPVITGGKGGPVQRMGNESRALGLTPDQLAAVQGTLKATGVSYQSHQDGTISVDGAHDAALRKAVAEALIAHRTADGKLMFRLDGPRGAEALAALDTAGIDVSAMASTFVTRARTRGADAHDTAAAAKAARAAMAAAEQEALRQRPGCYRKGDRYVVVRTGQPMQTVDQPPADALCLGDWPG